MKLTSREAGLTGFLLVLIIAVAISGCAPKPWVPSTEDLEFKRIAAGEDLMEMALPVCVLPEKHEMLEIYSNRLQQEFRNSPYYVTTRPEYSCLVLSPGYEYLTRIIIPRSIWMELTDAADHDPSVNGRGLPD